MPLPPVLLQPSSDPPVVYFGNNLPENLTTRDNDCTEDHVSKKARKTVPTVSFSITSSPLGTGDDMFFNNKKVLPTTLPKPTSLPSLTMSPGSPVTLSLSPVPNVHVTNDKTPPAPLITTETTKKPQPNYNKRISRFITSCGFTCRSYDCFS
jgi:hypothetical protein